jgi:hypothetical protein
MTTVVSSAGLALVVPACMARLLIKHGRRAALIVCSLLCGVGGVTVPARPRLSAPSSLRLRWLTLLIVVDDGTREPFAASVQITAAPPGPR